MVPTDFWEDARAALEAIKPVFLLAEWESRELHDRAFDMTYAWSWNTVMQDIAAGRANVDALRVHSAWNDKAYPQDSMRMLFVSNHDMNAWVGTEVERFGDMLEAAVVLSAVSDGMPLVHNGQEAGSAKRLAFFEKDPIEWREHATPWGSSTAGCWGSGQPIAPCGTAPGAPGWSRSPPPTVPRCWPSCGTRGTTRWWGCSTWRPTRTVTLLDGPFAGTCTDLTSGAAATLEPGGTVELPPWGYAVLVRGGGVAGA